MKVGECGSVGEERVGESMSAGIMGFAFVALTAMMSAVGKRRLDARAA